MAARCFINFPWGYDPKSDIPNQYTTVFLKYFAPVEFVADQNLSMMVYSTKAELIGKLIKGGKKCEHIHTGSMAEGLAVPDFLIMAEKRKVVMRDIDEMTVEENWYNANVSEEFTEVYGCGQTFEIEPTCNVPENYAFLKATSKFKKACELEGKPLRTEYLYNTTVLDDLEASWDIIGKLPGDTDRERHGPSVSHVHNTYLSAGRERDQVPALHFSIWPKIAEEWQTRIRLSNWPSKSLINYIVKKGHHMAPVGWHGSPTIHKEWRYSFSVAEKLLAQSISDEQRQVYVMLKLLHYFYFSEPKCLPTYCLKTLFFWSLERIPRKHFTQNTIGSLLYYLLDEIRLVLSKRLLPHYFIRKVNLLEHLPPEHAKTLCRKVENVRRNMINCLLNMDNKICFFALSHRMKLQKAFADLLENVTLKPTEKGAFLASLYSGLSNVLKSYLYMINSIQEDSEVPQDMLPIQINVLVKLCHQAMCDMSLCDPKCSEMSAVIQWVYILSRHENKSELVAIILLHMCALLICDRNIQNKKICMKYCPVSENIKEELCEAI